jgi:branched-chain amino acid transport system permease protein
MAISWDILYGFTGQLSFGHAALMGVGAYTSALLNLNFGLSVWLCIIIGGLLSALIGLVFALPSLRLRGPYFVISTIAISETFRLIANNWVEVTNGPYGLYKFSPLLVDSLQSYLLCLCIMIICILFAYYIIKSRIGLAFQTIREDEILASACGINTTFFKVLAFFISAFFAGLSGALYAHYVVIVTPTIMGSAISCLIMAMTLVGGKGTIIGPVIGAITLYSLIESLRFLGVVYNLVITSIIIILIILFFPGGIAQLFENIKSTSHFKLIAFSNLKIKKTKFTYHRDDKYVKSNKFN